MHDSGDWRILRVAGGVGLSDHSNQNIKPRQSHRLIKRTRKIHDVLMDLLELLFGQAESKQG